MEGVGGGGSGKGGGSGEEVGEVEVGKVVDEVELVMGKMGKKEGI